MKHFGYNRAREDLELLEKHRDDPPSFSIHLYPEYWTLNNGPKFAYNNPVSSLLDYIRSLSIPSDFIEILDISGVPYFEGCLVVELLDYRPQRAREPVLIEPESQRVVLRQNPETIWADICLLNKKNGSRFTDFDALDLEASILLATSPPLCIDPDPHLARIVNKVVRVSTPTTPQSLKRKATLLEVEEDETDKAKRLKLMQFMSPSAGRAIINSNFRLLDFLEKRRLSASSVQSRGSTPSVPPASVGHLMLPPTGSAPTGIMQESVIYEDQSSSRATPRIPTPLQSSAQSGSHNQSPTRTQQPSSQQQNLYLPNMPNQNLPPSRSIAPSPSQSSQRTATPGVSSVPQNTLPNQSQTQSAVQNSPQMQPQQQLHTSQPPNQQQQHQNPIQIQGPSPLPFQFAIPPPQFLNPPPAGKRKPAIQQQPQKAGTPSQQPSQMHPSIAANQHMAAYMRSQLISAQMQQGQPQNGRATPIAHINNNNLTRSPVTNMQQLGRASPMLPTQAAHASPMLPSQNVMSRPPLPQNANQQPQRPAPNAQNQLLQHQIMHNLNISGQGQYSAAQFRQMHPMQSIASQLPMRAQGTSTPASQQLNIHQQNNLSSQQIRPEQAAAMHAQVQMLAGMQYPPVYNYAVPHQQFAGWRPTGRGIPQLNAPQPNPVQSQQGVGRSVQGRH